MKTKPSIVLLLILFCSVSMFAQVIVPFNQRTSVFTPGKTIYNVKGDFTMIGNTNLTLVNYADDQNNSVSMRYVDIDGDSNTWNSSSATLELSTENGANPLCSNIVYAGLYWTGRASNAATSPNIFTVTREVPGGTVNVNQNNTIGHNQAIPFSAYNLVVSRNNPSNNNRNPIYTITNGTNSYVFQFTNNTGANAVTLSVNGEAAINVPVTISNSGNTRTATLVTPYVINDGNINITITSLVRNAATNLSITDTQNSSLVNLNVSGTTTGTITQSKTFDKRKVLLKGPNSASYTQITANANDIYYPETSDGFMYSAYAEVTDFVKTNGLGAYTVADLALIEGVGGSTGYYGGWGMVIVYENDKMKWRDVTVFDGHSYVAGSITADFEIPVSGFNTVQSGPVNMKLGMMAGEGDRGIPGDFFQIRNHQNNAWVTLSHGGNTTNNFFNSSIFTGGNTRNPNLLNNTGMDISMFDIPNTGNTIITNNQTSTRFRYGTTQDTYIIFNITMSVDAYIPEIEGLLSVQTINNQPAPVNGPYNVQPGQEVEFGIDIRNLGTEAVNDYKLVIPIPFTSTYVPGSLSSNIFFSPNPTPNNLFFDPTLGATGSIVWDFGTLPLPADAQTLLASVRFKLRATDNCAILSNPNCANNILVNGLSSGTGAITNIQFKDRPLIIGYNSEGICQGEPIFQPITANIIAGNFVAENCSEVPLVQIFNYCNGETSVSAAQLAAAFPPGSKFYATYPPTTPELTVFPVVAGSTTTYFAVPFNADGCYFEFKISACQPIVANDDNAGPINGASGATGVVNVFTNDTLNGNPVNPADVTLTLVTPDPTGSLTLNPDGSVDVAPGTPAGTYTLVYQICENLNPTNCDTATVTVTVEAPAIVANDDNAGPINGASGATGVVNVFTNDTLNGNPVNPADVTLTLVTPDPTGSLNLNPDGSVDVAPGTPAGTYTLVYQICENLNPTNCDTATVTVTVEAPAILANDDNAGPINGASGATGVVNVFTNDTLNGNPVNPADVTLTLVTPDPTGSLTLNPDGSVDVAPGTPAGTYTLVYQICENLNPTNCDTATVTVTVTASNIIAVNDIFSDISCSNSSIIGNVFSNDSLNGNSIEANLVVLSYSPMNGIFNINANGELTSNGIVAPGVYVIEYTICEVLNPSNCSSATVTINVTDNVSPVWSSDLPGDLTVQCSAIPDPETLVATDECSDVNIEFNETITPGSCDYNFTIVRTWVATDESNNSITHTQTIIVQDTTAPAFVEALPADATVECSDIPAAVSLTATDTCGDATVSFNETTQAGACAGSYTIVRTWTATDACGNTTSHTQTITVQDTTAPAFVEAFPADATVECSDIPAVVTLTATDTCGDATVSFNETTQAGTCAGSYTIVRTWTATDACGNTTSHTQTIIVQDTTAPAFVEALPADATVECSDIPAAVSLTATDTCGDATVSFNETTQAGACAGSYTIVRTWTATDACGNTTSHTQTIIVQDITAPAFVEALPADATVECSDIPAVVTLTATDTCGDATVSFNETTQAGACAGSYTIVRTWTATDACGNTTSHTQNITVQDTTAPAFVEALPADATVECSDIPAVVTLTATDTCGDANVSFNETTQAGACAGSYTIVRTWTATDACGNTTSHTQTITVQDITAPAFVEALPADATVECSDIPAVVTLTATDTCGDANVSFNETTQAGACAGSYTIVRTWTATDACGNTTSHTQTITVQDTTAPVITTEASSITVECDGSGNQSAINNWLASNGGATATDNCSEVTWTNDFDALNNDCSTAVVVTFTATDACGNTTTTSATFSINDTETPVAPAAPADVTVSCTQEVPVAESLTAQDACSGEITAQGVDTITPGTCENNYVITRTWTFVDACGNSTSVSQTITVQDTTAPAFVEALPADATVECSDVPAAVTLSATDNCGAANVAFSETIQAGVCEGAYTIIRTWTATDACGNTTSHTQTITVIDTTGPVFDQDIPSVITVECDSVPDPQVLTATDNCSAVNIVFFQNIVPGSCPNNYTIIRIWTASDACGNTTLKKQTINVQDTTPPVFVEELPSNLSIECSELPVAAILTATDNCGIATVSFNETTQAGTCAGSYTIVRTWNATDACGNTTSHTQTINVQDTTAPVFVETLPADAIVECSDVPAAVALTATDNCDENVVVAFNETIQEGACEGTYTIVRTWTATDACGNTASHTQTITVQDTTAPVITTEASSITVECDGSGNQSAINDWLASNGGASATDNCSEVTWTNDFDALNNDCSTAVVVTFTATDACGNTSTTSATFSINDTEAPVAPAAPADVTVSCTQEVPVAESLTAQDACSGEITAQGVDTITPGTCENDYVITRTWTFVDACGNSTSVSQTITVQDTIAPAFMEALPANATVECSDVPATVVLTATDNCGEATVTFNENIEAGTCAGSYTIVRTWTATDACGNTTSHTQTIIVQDTTAPAFVEALPADATVECSEVPAAAILTATDNCDENVVVAFNETIQEGACAGSHTIVRTWIATDACGNETSHTQTITVQDTTAPVFVETLPADATVECSDVPAAVALTATDNCDENVVVAFNETIQEGACEGAYTIVRTWNATDACGNTTSHTQTITVQDTTAPVFVEALPADAIVECSDVPAAVALTATDNCDENVVVAFNETIQEGACEGAYTIVRTWTATDACGNTTSHTQTITVQDTTAPVINTEASSITVECDGSGNQSAINDWLASNGGASATDNCSEVTWTNDFDALNNDCSTAVVVTFTATDACGNTSTTSATFSINDTEAPVAPAAPADVTVSCTQEVPVAESLTAQDACSGEITAQGVDTITPGTCENNYVITRTWTFVDACGNSTSVSQTITVQDTTAPAFVEALPADATVECSDVPAAVVLTATDNCGEATVTFNEEIQAGVCAGSYSIVRTWTATDVCGNTTSHTQTITVKDITAPVFEETLPADATVECSEVPAAAILTATDNCDDNVTVDFNETIQEGACAGSYTIVRTWIATDACGNETSHTQTIIVQDTTAPVFVETLPADATVECSDVPAAEVLTATDNCDENVEVAYIETIQASDCINSYTIVRTWTATDVCGNETTHVQTITVQDTTAPVFVEALPADATVECSEVPAAANLTATDNCDQKVSVTFSEDIQTGDCDNNYTIVRTWIATDICGNETTHVQTITVQDTIAPVFVETLPADATVECSEIPAAATLTATDNCGEATVTFSETMDAGDCAGSYTIIRTWTATDVCGNTTSHTQNITVQDTTDPVFDSELPANVTVECSDIPEAATLTATDNCGEATVTFSETIDAGDCAGNYTIIRTWTATDSCNNSIVHTQLITVEDNSAPVFVGDLPQNITVECSEVPAAATLTAIDNCGEATVAFSETIEEGACEGDFTITRTWVASDICGNTTSHTQVIVVEDNSTPVASPYDEKISVNCDAIPDAPALVFTDNCSSVDVVEFEEEITNMNQNGYTIIRTWFVSDSCGNGTTFTQTVSVTITDSNVSVSSELCIEDDPIDLTSLFGQSLEEGGTWVDVNNSGALQGSIFNPTLLSTVGSYEYQYVITDSTCPRTYTVVMNINDDCVVLPCQDIIVWNAVSPNDDGKNDFFFIENIDNECYLDNTVEIYNRWGVLVFETRGYDNTNRVFRGISEGRATVNKNAELPTGTYFYILQVSKDTGETVTRNGYLYLTR